MALNLTNPSKASTPRAALLTTLLRVGIVVAVSLLALSGCGGPDQGQTLSGSPQDPQSPPPPPQPPPTQVPDMKPPTGLTVAVSGTSVVLSWSQPTPPPEGYRLLAGPTADTLAFVTSSIPAGSSHEIRYLLSRGRTHYVALQSTRKLGSEYSASSDPIQVTFPTLEPATIALDCIVAHVNDGYYWTGTAFQGAYAPGRCATGTFHELDMGALLTRIFGATYTLGPSKGRVLDLGVVDGRSRDDFQDGPFPHIQFLLSPVGSVTPGSSWTNWSTRIGSPPGQIFGGVFEQFRSFCLDGIATSGTLMVTEAAGLDQSGGGGSFRIQGSVTFVDPLDVAGACTEYACCSYL